MKTKIWFVMAVFCTATLAFSVCSCSTLVDDDSSVFEEVDAGELVNTDSVDLPVGDTWTTPYEGVEHLFRVTDEPNRINAVKVDLSNPKIRIHVTRLEDREQTVSEFAVAYGCQVAINGDFFSYETYLTGGLAAGGGVVWQGTADNATEGFLAVGTDNTATISLPADIVVAPEPWMSEIVSGFPLIVDNGMVVDSEFGGLNPRTGVGLTEDGKTLILMTVEGRSDYAIGCTTETLGALMVEMGAWRAINLDGGGSTTLYIASEGGHIAGQSSGVERPVANHLGITIAGN